MTIRKLAMSWAPANTRAYCLPSSLLLTLSLGEAPETVPAAIDVTRGLSQPARTLDGGAVDRIICRYGGAARISRVHAAAASLNQPGRRHCRFDAVEQISASPASFVLSSNPGHGSARCWTRLRKSLALTRSARIT
jgi:hypothetical protein